MYDIIVIGAGPAGLTAALYAARAGKSVLMLEQEAVGGQIIYAPMVDNYPALAHVSGAEFVNLLTGQVEALGVQIEYAAATGVRRLENGFRVETDLDPYEAKALILSTGVQRRKLGLPGEDDLVGAGVSYCAVCDGAFYAGREVAVVGGGSTALEDALFLSGTCKKVTLIHRREEFRGEAHLVRQLREKENVVFMTSCTVEDLQTDGEGLVSGVTVADKITGSRTLLSVDALFIAVGQKSNNDPFSSFTALDEQGYFDAGEDTLTNVPGVFAAGDCRKKQVRQLTTAVGDGATAGISACRYVDGL